MAEDAKQGRTLPAIVTFVVVTAAVWITGLLATWALRHVVLPILALVIGFMAARIVWKARD